MDVVILIGLQASGKTTFYHQRLAADHAHVSKDAFPNARRRQRRQMRLIHDALRAGRSGAVDNTNPSPDEWQPIIEAARSHAARVVGYWFPPDPTASLRRNTARAGKTLVPDIGVYATLKRLRRPRLDDGFDELHVVEFDGTGGFVIQPLTEEG
jgi:predicted kinase